MLLLLLVLLLVFAIYGGVAINSLFWIILLVVLVAMALGSHAGWYGDRWRW
jgi:hypothetical protein